MKTAKEIVTRAIDAAGEAGGYDEVAAIAAKGPGAMTFSDEEMSILIDAYGSPGDALYAIQLEAQNRVSAIDHAPLFVMTNTYEELLQEVRRLQDTGALPSHPTRDQRADWAFGNTKIENSDVTREMAERAVDQKADDKGKRIVGMVRGKGR